MCRDCLRLLGGGLSLRHSSLKLLGNWELRRHPSPAPVWGFYFPKPTNPDLAGLFTFVIASRAVGFGPVPDRSRLGGGDLPRVAPLRRISDESADPAGRGPMPADANQRTGQGTERGRGGKTRRPWTTQHPPPAVEPDPTPGLPRMGADLHSRWSL